MLDGAGTKKFFPLKMLAWLVYKTSLSQYVRLGWHKKDLFTENLKRGLLGGAGTKMLSSRKMLDGNGIEKASLTQYVRRVWRKKPLFTENARRGWYKKTL